MSTEIAWNYKKLGELAGIVKGRTPSRENKKFFSRNEKDIPWVKIENLRQREVSEAGEYLTPEGADLMKIIPPDSVLLSVNKTIGRVGIATVPLATNEQIFAVCLQTKEILPEYLYYYFLFAQTQLEQLAYVTVGKRIGRETLANMVIPFPELEVQTQWLNILKKTEDYLMKKKDMRELLKRLDEQKSRMEELWFKENISARVEQCDNLLRDTVEVAESLLYAVLNVLFSDGNRDKEKRYYAENGTYWTRNPLEDLNRTLRGMLGQMSDFQRSLYAQFLQSGEPSAIHEMLKQLKRTNPGFADYSIQDAVATVEVFRQLGLMAEPQLYKLDENEEEPLYISLWQCVEPNRSR